MTRKLSAVFLLSLFIVAFLSTAMVVGADKPYKPMRDRASVPVRFAPVYGFGGAEQSPFVTAPEQGTGDQMMLGSPMAQGPNPVQLGDTYYDYQHNCTMGRQAEHRGTNYLHLDWMRQGAATGYRGMSYQVFDLAACGGNEGAGNHPRLFALGGSNISGNRAGYVTMDVDYGGNCGIPGAHEQDANTFWYSNGYFDLCAGSPLGAFTPDSVLDANGWMETQGTRKLDPAADNANIWPKIEWQIGTATVLHMVACESGDGPAGSPNTISYYRRVGAYGVGLGVWSDQRVIDTVMNINPTVTADRNSDKVAIVWAVPAAYKMNTTFANEYENQLENDVWYAIATDQGALWVSTPTTSLASHSIARDIILSTPGYSGGNITNYAWNDPYKAYCDISALFTTDGNLHVAWSGRQWTDTTSIFRRNSAIFHWDQSSNTINRVAKADWDSGGTCYGHAWGGDVAKMSLTECAGRLYCTFSQFGSKTHPCDQFGAAENVVSGFLMMSVSSDGGTNWDRPRRASGQTAPTFPCTEGALGTCNSEYWASAARFGRVENCGDTLTGKNVIDVLFINDKAPGGVVQPESGVWVSNPVMWLRTVCRPVIPEALWNDDGGAGFGECYNNDRMIVVNPNSDTSLMLHVENTGLLSNTWSINYTYIDGAGWMTGSKPGGTMLSKGIDSVEFTFTAPAGAPDPSTWKGSIVITNQSVDDSPRSIPVCMVVASNFIWPDSAVLATTCKRIKIFNTGVYSNNATNAALDFIQDCDTFNPEVNSAIYLYDGGPIVCRIKGSDTLRFSGYSSLFTDNDGMRPLTPWTVDSLTKPAYSYATSRYCTADSAIGFTAEYYVPKAGDSCSFIIQKLKFYNRTAATITGVLVGEFIDWDVPSDTGSNNGSDFDLARNLIYQFGAEYNDTTEGQCAQQQTDRYAGLALDSGATLKNAMTLDNATYVYTSGPYGNTAPIPPGVMYKLMKTKTGFSKYAPSGGHPESTYTDLSTLMTFGEYSLAPTDTIRVIKVLSTTKTGLADLISNISKGFKFINNHPEIKGTCCNAAGDANNDNAANVGDAVYLINRVFKGGNPPPCPAEGDPNKDGSVNVGDAVFMINRVFKGGAAPQCGTAQ